MHATLRIVTTLLVGLGAFVGCDDYRAPRTIHLVDDPGITRTDPMLTWGELVTINGVSRRVISASKPIVPPSEETWTKGHQVGAVIPPELGTVPWIVFATTVTRNGKTSVMRWLPVVGRQAGNRFDYGVVDDRVGPDGKVGITLWPVPDLAKRDVVTGDLAIPAGARLDVGVAVESQTWSGTLLPIEMTVTAIAGSEEIVLRTVQVDPRNPEDRDWKDISIPLDPIAGRTVRVRFSARPIAGPTALPGLPLWAEPRITDQRS